MQRRGKELVGRRQLELEGWVLEDLVMPPGLRERRMQALQDD